MKMTIREERPEEFAAIYDLVKTAFATAKMSDGDEQEFVNRLRASGDYIPQLALVAEDAKGLAGHVMLTRARLDVNGEVRETLLLAPLCVEISHRDNGLGAQLVEESFRRARAMGFTSVFLLGDPAYYARFGLRDATVFAIGNAHGFPAPYFMGCELIPGALAAGGIFSCGTPA